MAGSGHQAQLITSLFEHVCLPPRLPSREDDQLVEVERAILQRLLSAARKLRDHGMLFQLSIHVRC